MFLQSYVGVDLSSFTEEFAQLAVGLLVLVTLCGFGCFTFTTGGARRITLITVKLRLYLPRFYNDPHFTTNPFGPGKILIKVMY